MIGSKLGSSQAKIAVTKMLGARDALEFIEKASWSSCSSHPGHFVRHFKIFVGPITHFLTELKL
jgi:hypothetical protein